MLQGVKGERYILHAIKGKGADRIGHTLRRNVTEVKIEGTRRRERRSKQLQDGLKEKIRC